MIGYKSKVRYRKSIKLLLENPFYIYVLMPINPENTLFVRGKYHCMADLMFDWFVFDQTCKSLSGKQLNPNQSNKR